MYYLGLDLGSTATKAVLMDDERTIMGKGLTPTGADIVLASERAKAEALIDARVTYLLTRIQGIPKGFCEKLRDHFQEQRVLAKFDTLRQRCKEAGQPALTSLEKNIYRTRPSTLQDYLDAAVIEEKAKKVIRKSLRELEKEVPRVDFESCMRAAFWHVPPEPELGIEDFEDALTHTLAHKFEVRNVIATGYGRLSLPFQEDQVVTEISCHGKGASYLFPGTRCILDIGGQDTKGIRVDEKGKVYNFVMNDKCAAGTGKFLQNIAKGMKLRLEDIGPLSLQSTKDIKISNTCTVFAEDEARSIMNNDDEVGIEDILKSMHRAIAKRSLGLLRRVGIENELTFTGGVALNVGVVAVIREELTRGTGNITVNVCEDSQYIGAIGAALFALEKDDPR